MKINYIVEYMNGTDEAKTRIMIAALREFATRSLDGARTREIAKLAGVNHAAISYYFGGKDELYMELVREIAEYILIFGEPYFKRAEAIEKSGSAEEAKRLLFDFNMSRVASAKTRDDEIFSSVILLISREEMYPTKAFEIFFSAFRKINEVMEKMVKVASNGAIDGIDSKIIAEMLMGQIHIFNSSRKGFMRNNGWKKMGNEEAAMVGQSFNFILDKIFKK